MVKHVAAKDRLEMLPVLKMNRYCHFCCRTHITASRPHDICISVKLEPVTTNYQFLRDRIFIASWAVF